MSKITFEHKLESLRTQYPNMFDDKDSAIDFDDFYVLDMNENLGEYWEWLNGQSSIADIEQEEFEAFGGHPGGLDREQSIDTLAFYLPFHLYPENWGVYVYAHGIQTIKNALQPYFSAGHTVMSEQYRLSLLLLEKHESFHHKTEMFVTRLEAILRQSCYIDAIIPRYNLVRYKKESYEETCANSFAREKVLSDKKVKKGEKVALRKQINEFFKNQPPGYCEAAGTSQNSWRDTERKLLFDDYYNESIGINNISSTSKTFDWDLTGYWDEARNTDIDTRKFILVKKASPLGKSIPKGLCELKLGNFKRKLRKKGASLERHGANHDIWSLDGKKTTIPRHDHADIGIGLKRAIERQLGILNPI
tara:strand:- start:1283 stop:2368 length:1086 start_codon:yes stop_codon:yes gene_type:complete